MFLQLRFGFTGGQGHCRTPLQILQRVRGGGDPGPRSKISRAPRHHPASYAKPPECAGQGLGADPGVCDGACPYDPKQTGTRRAGGRRSIPAVNFYDAHNHLQDDRFGGQQGELLTACEKAGVRRMVVNGACESDWPQVLALARENKIMLPSFGYHPWYLGERTPDWQSGLEKLLDEIPSAVGEIGLDRWKPDLAYDGQEEIFLTQLGMAARRNVPALSLIHISE